MMLKLKVVEDKSEVLVCRGIKFPMPAMRIRQPHMAKRKPLCMVATLCEGAFWLRPHRRPVDG